MAMMECGCCGQPVDARSMRACASCGSALCTDCDENLNGMCPECGDDPSRP